MKTPPGCELILRTEALQKLGLRSWASVGGVIRLSVPRV